MAARGEGDYSIDDLQRALCLWYPRGLEMFGNEQGGETALTFFEGRFSHAIRKGPLLPKGGAATSGLFATEAITPRVPGADEMRLAEKVVRAVPFGTPLYARVDLIRDDDGAPCLLELEMTEPSLFFVHAAGSAEKFAAAVQRWLDAHGRQAG